MVDNGTLQAGEYGGWLGVKYDPIVIRPAAGEPLGGVSRTLGSEVLNLADVDFERVASRKGLLSDARKAHAVARKISRASTIFTRWPKTSCSARPCGMPTTWTARIRRSAQSYGNHLGGQSMLLARRLTEAGVPVVQVCCAAGDLNGGQGDMWDTHADNFNRLKNRLLPVFDRGASALLQDLADRGTLDETLVVVLTDFGRTPQNQPERRPRPLSQRLFHRPGRRRHSRRTGLWQQRQPTAPFRCTQPCGPPDVHATIFQALGISPRAEMRDMLGRPFAVSDGEVLPLF